MSAAERGRAERPRDTMERQPTHGIRDEYLITELASVLDEILRHYVDVDAPFASDRERELLSRASTILDRARATHGGARGGGP